MEVGSISALSLEGRLEAAYLAQSLAPLEKVNVPSESQPEITPANEQPVRDDAVYVTIGGNDLPISSVYNRLGELGSVQEADPTPEQLRAESVNEDQIAFLETEGDQGSEIAADSGAILSIIA